MPNERIATIAITSTAIVLTAATIAFAAFGGDYVGPRADDLPTVTTSPASPAGRRAPLVRDESNAASLAATVTPESETATVAPPAPAPETVTPSRGSSPRGAKNAARGKPDDKHEVVKPRVRDSDDDHRPKDDAETSGD